MIELKYRQSGDYLLPDLGLTEAEQMPLGKYGLMRQRYLEENRPGLYTRLMLSGKLMEHLQEIAALKNAQLTDIYHIDQREPRSEAEKKLFSVGPECGWDQYLK